jgi:ubiquinone/menaquinone biosynthesis C-methylase UbiE
MLEIEQKYVHDMYECIAQEFSDSRFCVWKFVKEFLQDKELLYGLDVGCGNGKNMIYDNIIGIDTCSQFVDICKKKGKDVIESNCIELPFENRTFDYVMAISVIHHLVTDERRFQSVKEMIRVTKLGGNIVFNVWSVENQDKRKFIAGDNYVPWIFRPKKNIKKRVLNRYYYVYNYDLICNFMKLLKKQCKDIEEYTIFNEKGNWVVKMKKVNE